MDACRNGGLSPPARSSVGTARSANRAVSNAYPSSTRCSRITVCAAATRAGHEGNDFNSSSSSATMRATSVKKVSMTSARRPWASNPASRRGTLDGGGGTIGGS